MEPDRCADVIRDVAGLIGRDNGQVRAGLSALPLRAAVGKDDMRIAHRLVRAGVPGPELAAAVRRAKLGLPETPRYCERPTLCDRGVALGRGTIIAPLAEGPDGRFGLELEGRSEVICALLSIARGAPAPAHTVDRLSRVSSALRRGERTLAEMELALIGQPALTGGASAESLAKAAAALEAGRDPATLMNRAGFAPPVEKASPDDPKHPGWPKGEPNGRGGQFRPKGDGDTPGGGENGGPGGGKTGPGLAAGGRALAEVIKTGIRRLIAAGINARDNARLVMLLAEVGLEARPYVSAYFDSPKTLEELQRAAQGPRERGYEDHHIVEQATANPDGSERALMDSPDNLARIPTAKHWELNSWYEIAKPTFGDRTPRQYLKGKSWAERRRVGLEGLREIGVLK